MKNKRQCINEQTTIWREQEAIYKEQTELVTEISGLCELKAMLQNEEKKKSMAEDTRRTREARKHEKIFLKRLNKMEMERQEGGIESRQIKRR
ncbi:MAG: hypothetical protein LBT59_27995 [Clostridiales bacterium]|jgi:hypothetical protein|nr:hypothetical protein [Clostridiales bacterium]